MTNANNKTIIQTQSSDTTTASIIEKVGTTEVYEVSTSVFDVKTKKVSNVVDPSSDQDSATKKYVDDHNVSSIILQIDGGGSVISTGVVSDLRVSFDCTITKATLLADQSGSIVIDIWKDTYANYAPTDADSITSSTPPTLSSADKSEDSTLTGWTKSISSGDILRFNVDSASTVTRAVLVLEIQK